MKTLYSFPRLASHLYIKPDGQAFLFLFTQHVRIQQKASPRYSHLHTLFLHTLTPHTRSSHLALSSPVETRTVKYLPSRQPHSCKLSPAQPSSTPQDTLGSPIYSRTRNYISAAPQPHQPSQRYSWIRCGRRDNG